MIYIVSRVSPNEWKVEEAPDGEEMVANEFTMQNSAWFVAGALMCQGSELSPMYVNLLAVLLWFVIADGFYCLMD